MSLKAHFWLNWTTQILL